MDSGERANNLTASIVVLSGGAPPGKMRDRVRGASNEKTLVS